MEKMKGFMTKVRRRRLALFLVFALMLGIAPKYNVYAFNNNSSNSMAARAVANDEPFDPREFDHNNPDDINRAAKEFKRLIEDLLTDSAHTFSDKSVFGEMIITRDSNNKIEDVVFTGKLKAITDILQLDPNGSYYKDLNDNRIVVETKNLPGAVKINEKITAFSSILRLLEYADNANIAISNAVEATISKTDEQSYNTFVSKYTEAKEALEDFYYEDMDMQQNLEVLGDCLGSRTNVTVRKYIKNSRIDDLGKYETITKDYNIETAFHDMVSKSNFKDVGDGSYNYEYNPTTCSLLKGLKDIVAANGGDSRLIQLYNGKSIIKKMLDEYDKVDRILTPLDALTSLLEKKGLSAPNTQDDIKEVIRLLELYNALPSEVKSRITPEVITKLNTYSIGSEEVKAVSDLIGEVCEDGKYPSNDAEYATFKDRYNTAYSSYMGLIGEYGSSSGVEKLVLGASNLLGDMTTVYNFLERVHRILNTDDNQMCNHYNEIEHIVTDFRGLSALNQSRIYNYAAFNTVYQNATVAEKLRTRIDKLLLTLTADELDRQEVEAIRKEYSGLNAKAKVYFGTSYANYIDELEYGNYAKSLELASRVDELIGRIGTINTNSGQKIADAENAYNALTDMQKALVKTYATLVAARKAYDLIKNDVSKAKVLGIAAGYVYTRKYIIPSPRVFIDNKQLVAGTDYTLSYSKNKSVGTAKITITAVSGSGYFGTYTKSFKIVKDSISDGKVSNVKSSYKYTGKSIKPTPKLKVNGYTLKKGTDYTVTYSNNKKKGKATITLKGKGNYKGSKKKTFKIK